MNPYRARALVAVFLAIALVWVAGLGGGQRPASLGEGTDHGLVGATAEPAQAGSLPSAKHAADASGIEGEGEQEVVGEATLGHGLVVVVGPQGVRLEVERGPPVPEFRGIASIGARGPPVA